MPPFNYEHDFFISFKWRTYADEAEEVTRRLQTDGYDVWLDRDRLPLKPGQRIEERVLKQVIAEAVRSSYLMVFFETFAQAEVAIEVAMTAGGRAVPVHRTSNAFNWQEFEREYADRLVYVYPSSGTMEFPGTREKVEFETLDDVVAKLEEFHPVPIRRRP